MSKICTIILMMVYAISVSAQVYTVDWGNGLMDDELPDGTVIDTAYGYYTYLASGDSIFMETYHETRQVAVDGLGNTFDASDILGNYFTPPSWASTAFDPGIVLNKRSPDGNLLWKKYFTGLGHVLPWGLETDQDNNVYLCGEYSLHLEVDTEPQSKDTLFAGADGYAPNGFALKLDPSGNTALALNFECSQELNCYDIKVDASQNIYVVGSFHGTADFDPGPGVVNESTAGPTLNLFVVKLDANGHYLWHHTTQSSELSRAYKCAIDPEGALYITGEFSGTCDFSGTGADPRIASGWEGFIFKLDASGDYQWARDYGRVFRAAHFDGTHLVVSGKFSGTLNIDPGGSDQTIHSASNEHAYLQKLTPEGVHAWATEVGTGLVNIRGISSNDLGEIIVAGKLQSASIFEINGSPDTLSNQMNDLFVGIYNAENSLIWVKSWLSSGNDWLNDVAFINDQAFMLGGTFTEELYLNDDDLLVYQDGQHYDGLAFRASKCTESLSLTPVVCDAYVSPSGKYVWSSTGNYLDTVQVSGGCDILYSVALTIQAPDTGVTISEDALVSDAVGASYTWLDCDNGFQAIAGENQAIFVPSSSGNYAVEVNNTGCIDTSACYHMIITGVDEFVFDNAFEIYPNPTQDQLTVSFKRPIDHSYSISIHNTLGQMIYAFQPAGQRSDLDLRGLDNGVYLIHLKNSTGTAVYKILKQ